VKIKPYAHVVRQTPKEFLAEVISEDAGISQFTDGILSPFTASEKIAILARTNDRPTVESIRKVSEKDWRKMRNIGDRFIVKLIRMGWIGERDLVDRERRVMDRVLKLKKDRAEKVRNMISRFKSRVSRLERELLDLESI